jgi:hypothetical protein
MTEMSSFPSLKTSMFDESGSDEYRSKFMILVFAPSLLVVILTFWLLVMPMISGFKKSTTVDIQDVNFQWLYKFNMFNNQTNLIEGSSLKGVLNRAGLLHGIE